MARRLGDRGSGPRTVGYDANPSGIAGTTSSASDYKKAKEAKKKDKNRVELGDPPPYENDEGFIPGHNGIQYFTETLDPKTKDYKPDKVIIGKGVAGTEGEGWTLSLQLKEVGKVITLTDWNNNRGNIEGIKSGTVAYFNITNVNRQGNIKMPTAPLENGMVKHDHKVRMPKTLRITGYVSRENVNFMNSLISCAEQATSLESYFMLSSPWYNFPAMYLQKYTSKADNRKYDVYDYTIELTELMFAKDLKDKTSDAELASNTDKGAAKGK